MKILREVDQKIIAALQEPFPLVSNPYAVVAARAGVTEEELLAKLAVYRRKGILRRMGLVVQQRAAGFLGNALSAWRAAEKDQARTAKILCASPAVSHCYVREAFEDWPYTIYAMIHAASEKQCRSIAAQLAQESGTADYVLLFTEREWKKSAPHYFAEKRRE